MSFKEDRFCFSISAQQHILLNSWLFREYFVPASKAFHVYLTSFFQIQLLFQRGISAQPVSGTISIVILCSCYMLNFRLYVQPDQFDEAKQSVNVPCIIFYHKDPLNRNECSFS